MKKIPDATVRRLMVAARVAAKRAYAPYSRFCVGAAVLGGSGKIYSGCNVENASYGLCICAERAAIFNAVGQGERAVRCVVIYTPTKAAASPCGACRQVMFEFGAQARVISVCDGAEVIDTSLAELLPGAFRLPAAGNPKSRKDSKPSGIPPGCGFLG